MSINRLGGLAKSEKIDKLASFSGQCECIGVWFGTEFVGGQCDMRFRTTDRLYINGSLQLPALSNVRNIHIWIRTSASPGVHFTAALSRLPRSPFDSPLCVRKQWANTSHENVSIHTVMPFLPSMNSYRPSALHHVHAPRTSATIHPSVHMLLIPLGLTGAIVQYGYAINSYNTHVHPSTHRHRRHGFRLRQRTILFSG